MVNIVLRRGKELVENELESGSAAETMTGEELKIQVRSRLPSKSVGLFQDMRADMYSLLHM